jgi:hypothetical protein
MDKRLSARGDFNIRPSRIYLPGNVMLVREESMMLTPKQITEQLSPEQYALLHEKVFLDGHEEFGVESVVKNSQAHAAPIVIVRVDGTKTKTYYL